MNIEQAKRELKKKAFSFEDNDGSLKNKTVWLKDVIEILDALSLLAVVSQQNEQLFCAGCGHKKQFNVYTDINSGRSCKNQLCKQNNCG